MPTKLLPARADINHLKLQAKDLLRLHRAGDPAALQRIREFHPKFRGMSDADISNKTYTLVDAQLSIAREYGFASWQRLRSAVAEQFGETLKLSHHERLDDVVFRQAVDLLDSGDAERLRTHLEDHPDLVRQRVTFEGGNYFTNPSLLEFVAENPIRNGRLPDNIVKVATVILDAGASTDKGSVSAALGLVSSGCVVRECNVQVPLIDLLCDHGGDPDSAMGAALGHGEFDAVDALLRHGAQASLSVAAATGRFETVHQLVSDAGSEDRHRALALAAQHGHGRIVKLLLEAGEDPNRYNPMNYHSHSTPLHQAALAGWEDVVRVLVEAGARTDIKDLSFGASPIGWAEHAGHSAIAQYLRSRVSQ